MDDDVFSYSRILEHYVIPSLQSIDVSKDIQNDVAAIFEEHIRRSLTCFGENLGMCADIISTQMQNNDDEVKLEKILGDAKTSLSQMETYISRGWHYFTDIFIKGFNSEKSDDGSFLKDPVHVVAIRKNFSRLRFDLLLQETNIIDNLVAENVLTEDDKDSIVAKQTPRDINEEFLKRLCDKCNYDQFTKVVLPAFKEYHPHLENDLQETLRELAKNPETRDDKKCGWCLIQTKVDPRRLADYLFNNNAISQNMHSVLRKEQLPIPDAWKALLGNLKDYVVLEKALKAEYPVIFDKIIRKGGFSQTCKCSKDDNSKIHPQRNVPSRASSDIARLSDLESMLGDDDFRSSVSGETTGGAHWMPRRKVLGQERKLDLIEEYVEPSWKYHQQDEQENIFCKDTEIENVEALINKSRLKEETFCGVCGVSLTNPDSAVQKDVGGQPSLSSIAQQLTESSVSLDVYHTHRLSPEHQTKSRLFDSFIKMYFEDNVRHLFHELSFFIDFHQLRCPKMLETCYADVSLGIAVLVSEMDQVKLVIQNILVKQSWELADDFQQAVFSLYEDYLNERVHISDIFIQYQKSLKDTDNPFPVVAAQHDTSTTRSNRRQAVSSKPLFSKCLRRC